MALIQAEKDLAPCPHIASIIFFLAIQDRLSIYIHIPFYLQTFTVIDTITNSETRIYDIVCEESV